MAQRGFVNGMFGITPETEPARPGPQARLCPAQGCNRPKWPGRGSFRSAAGRWPCRRRLRHLRRGERYGDPEQRAQNARTGRGHPAEDGGGHVHFRRAHPTLHIALSVLGQSHRIGARQDHRPRRRWRRPRSYPFGEGGKSCLDDRVLRAHVDLVGAAQDAGVAAHNVRVRVGGPRHFPRADAPRVRLLRGRVAELRHVGLRLEHEHRYGQVGADPQGGRTGTVARDRCPTQRSAGAAPAMNENPIEGLGQRLDGVREGGQVERRLGFADGDDVRGWRPAKTWGDLSRRSARPTWAKMSKANWSPG